MRLRPDIVIVGTGGDRRALEQLAERWQGILTWEREAWEIEIASADPDDAPSLRQQVAAITDESAMAMHWPIYRITGRDSGLVIWDDDYIRLNWTANAPDDAALPRLFAGAAVWTPTVWRDVRPVRDVAQLSEFLALLHAEERADGAAALSTLDDVRAWRGRSDDGDVVIVASAAWI